MTDSWYVACHFDAVGQSHPSDLAERGIWFFRGRSVDAYADPSTLRASLQGGCVFLINLALSPMTDQLIKSRHIQVNNDSRLMRYGKMLNRKFNTKSIRGQVDLTEETKKFVIFLKPEEKDPFKSRY